MITFFIGLVLYITSIIVSVFFEPGIYITLFLFILSYLLIGYKTILEAFKKIIHGELLDEDFLVFLASSAAFFVGEYYEAVGIMLFFQIGELFEDYASDKTQSSIEEALDLRPETVLLTGMGKEQEYKEIPASSAMIDDVLLVRAGDRIPLDGVVVDGESYIDTSPLTGESVPVQVNAGSQVLSGCINLSGSIRIKVIHMLDDSAASRILASVKDAESSKPKAVSFITKFSQVYTPVIIVIAILTAVIPSLFTWEWNKWLYTAVSFLVISCPCALIVSVPLAFFTGIGTGAKHGILFKGGDRVEALTGIDVVALDKTGTLTKGNFEVESVCPFGEYSELELLAYAAAAERESSHPIGKSIVKAYSEKKLPVGPIISAQSIKELRGEGIISVVDGRELVIGRLELLESNDVKDIHLPDEALGKTIVYMAIDNEYAGYIVISDTLKEDSIDTISGLKQSGLKVALLTGDSKESAAAVAKQLSIEKVLSKLLPDEKLSAIKAIQSGSLSMDDSEGKKQKVLFVGDGINDAPVLAGADVSMAMGAGADAAIESADVVLLHNDAMDIVRSYRLAKKIRRVAIENIVFSLVIKLSVIVLGMLGFSSMWYAVFADTGVTMLCILNSCRLLLIKRL